MWFDEKNLKGTYLLDTFQDFLINEHMKPRMHILEKCISSLNHVIVRPTKTPKLADKNWAHFYQIKGFKNWSFQKMPITIYVPLNWYSSMKKKFRKIRIIFDIENWLWKSEIRIFQSPPAKHTLICQKKLFMEKCYFSLN